MHAVGNDKYRLEWKIPENQFATELYSYYPMVVIYTHDTMENINWIKMNNLKIIKNNSTFAEKEFIPMEYSLSQNYPNPFNPTTSIKYTIPKSQFVSLKMFDMLGKEVVTLVNEVKNAGKYEINFDASTFASGIYFYQLQSGNFTETKKLVLIK